MHYLVVAKVKDYPDDNKLISGLTRQTDIIGKMDLGNGKWENIIGEFPSFWKYSFMFPKLSMTLFYEMLGNYGKDVPCESKKYANEELNQKRKQFILEHGFWVDDENEDVYAKVSGHFDYIIPGEKYDMETEEQKAKYKDVIAKFGKVDVFVLPDYECRFTKHKGVECPYKDDDEVWVLDGYTYCEW